MTFNSNLIKARSHIIFLLALGCGLALVTAIDRTAEKTGPTQSGHTPMVQFDDVTPLPLAITGTSSSMDLEHALIARFGTLGRVETQFLLRSDNGLVFTSRKYTALIRSYGLR